MKHKMPSPRFMKHEDPAHEAGESPAWEAAEHGQPCPTCGQMVDIPEARAEEAKEEEEMGPSFAKKMMAQAKTKRGAA